MFSAAASHVSARTAGLSTQPWVVGVVTSVSSSQTTVTVSNAGPGLALDVRVRIRGGAFGTGHWTSQLEAMPPGKKVPQGFSPPHDKAATDEVLVETDYSDLRGARWRITNSDGVRVRRRLRTQKFDVWRARS